MRLKSAGVALGLRNLVPVAARDLGVLLCCILFERTSLPAFRLVARAWRRTLRRRRWIQQHRRVTNAELARWFRFRPVALPVPRARGGLHPAQAHAPWDFAIIWNCHAPITWPGDAVPAGSFEIRPTGSQAASNGMSGSGERAF